MQNSGVFRWLVSLRVKGIHKYKSGTLGLGEGMGSNKCHCISTEQLAVILNLHIRIKFTHFFSHGEIGE